MQRPTVLSIAGSDSGGGAGIQADLAAFSWFGTHGTTAITAVTAQNPQAVRGVVALEPDAVQAQIEAVFEAFTVAAVKTGMLFSAPIIRRVAACLRQHRAPGLVVDPVMVATSGARLLQADAVAALLDDLVPLATLITPNLPETAVLLGRPVSTPDEARAAAVALARRQAGLWVLVKGGHADGPEAEDLLAHGDRLWGLRAPRQTARTTHGTGCSLSAAIAAGLARGLEPLEAVRQSKAYVLGRLAAVAQVGPAAWAMVPPEALPLEAIHVTEYRP
jgi:hydroxymethylpyrimidine/phosphomethylpyrimidine kinase